MGDGAAPQHPLKLQRSSPEEAEERRTEKTQPVRRKANAEVQVEQPRPLAIANAEAEGTVALPGEQAIAAAAESPKDGIPTWSKHDFVLARNKSGQSEKALSGALCASFM